MSVRSMVSVIGMLFVGTIIAVSVVQTVAPFVLSFISTPTRPVLWQRLKLPMEVDCFTEFISP